MTPPNPVPVSAGAIAAAVRAGEASALDVVESHLECIARLNPEVNALSVVFADRARGAAADVDTAARRRRRPRPAGGCAFLGEGEHRPDLVGDDERLERARRRHPGARRHDRAAAAGGRGRARRPRQHARLRHAVGHRQRSVRAHPQPVEPRSQRRRIQRRRRRRRRDGHERARARQRLRRLTASSRLRRRYRRPASFAGPGAACGRPRAAGALSRSSSSR